MNVNLSNLGSKFGAKNAKNEAGNTLNGHESRNPGAGLLSPHPAGERSGDHAKFSPDELQLVNLTAAVAGVPVVRQERVVPLAQAVRNGTYSVSDRQIGHALARDFGSTNSPE